MIHMLLSEFTIYFSLCMFRKKIPGAAPPQFVTSHPHFRVIKLRIYRIFTTYAYVKPSREPRAPAREEDAQARET